jgi:hypothetical protein
MKKSQQEFFTLGVSKPTMHDVQDYLNRLGSAVRILSTKDLIRSIEHYFKTIKNLKLDRSGRRVLSFESYKLKSFKDFDNITEARDAYIWDTKPKTLEDAEDPEVMTNGFGRIAFSQIKDKLIYGSKQFVKWAQDGNYDSIDSYMSSYHNLLETLQVIEKEMKKPAWKKKITTLKRAGK